MNAGSTVIATSMARSFSLVCRTLSCAFWSVLPSPVAAAAADAGGGWTACSFLTVADAAVAALARAAVATAIGNAVIVRVIARRVNPFLDMH